MRTGDIAEIPIERVAFGGHGIGLLDGRVVFVPFTVDGDIVRIEISEIRKNYARGILREVLAPSAYRTNALCRDYGLCGGCCYQHILYSHQLRLKEKQICDIFERIGEITAPPLQPLVPSPSPYQYRLKADFHLSNKPKTGWKIGLMSGSSNRIVEIARCEIVEESINRRLLRYRENLGSGQNLSKEDRITLWADDPAESTSPEEHIVKHSVITRTVKDRHMTVPYHGFFQANRFLIGEMVDRVMAAANLHGDETVVDGFCGSGLFSLFLAPLAGSVHGIEGNRQAVRTARKNAERYGLRNVFFYEGDVASVLKETFLKACQGIDTLILDPPRTGCGQDLLAQAVLLSPSRIVYVSCNPATQARDIRHLTAAGYDLESLQPLDMFPQTAHIEVIAVLSRPS